MPDIARVFNAALTGFLTGLGVVLYASGLGRVLILLRRKSPRILMYHACEPEETGFTRGLSINTPPACFEAQLDFLARYYRVVPLEDLCGGSHPDRAVAITFDDGYRSVHEHAFPQLKARGFPATVFLVSEAVDNAGIVWLNALNWYLGKDRAAARALISDRLGLPRSTSWNRFLDDLIAAYDPVAIAELGMTLEARLGASALREARDRRLYLESAELAEMARHGITYGNHSASHPNLGRLSAEAQREEIAQAKRKLDTIAGAIGALAYPFGIFDESTISVASELGYSMLLEVKGDNAPLDPLHLARLNVTSDSPAILFARMEVVYPIKAALNRLAKFASRRIRANPR